jgi:peptide methionine sulfoxide reductase msrA/msrB
MKEIYFAGGCFWGTQHFFKQIDGVIKTVTGFANGCTDNPTYEDVYTDNTGYAETVFVQYDEKKINLEFLLDMFFKAIDPTILNRQGNDIGTRYRSGVYYKDDNDLEIINKVFIKKQKLYNKPIVTEIEKLKTFFPAEEYHQNYLDKHPDGYCHLPFELFQFAKETKMQSHI